MASSQEQVVDPWDVKGAVVNGVQQAINYDKLINEFGSTPIDQELLWKFERVINLVAERSQADTAGVVHEQDQAKTKLKLHRFLRRNIFFSHRDLHEILDRVEKKLPVYLYTGRGPSSDSMHLGHMVPFIFCKWLQDVLQVPLVIQLTDDEKFLFKDLTLEQCHQFALQNCRDIIACGFDPALTFIFSNLDYVGGAFYANIVRIQKCINCNQSKSAFGFDDMSSIGKIAFVAVQAAPAFCSSFPQIFGTRQDVPCLIPAAIDQDPYFRLTRDVSKRLKHPKCTLIHSKFFPSLTGPQSKMSASLPNTTIYMTDTAAQIKKKVNKGFSGGQALDDDHKRLGGNIEVDVAYQYLTFFLDDDDELAKLGAEYKAGTLSSGAMKAKCIETLSQFTLAFQTARAAVTNETVALFMDSKRELDYIKQFPVEQRPQSSNGSANKKSKQTKVTKSRESIEADIKGVKLE